TIRLFQATITSCGEQCGPSSPDWQFKAKEALLHLDRVASLYHLSFWIKGAPIFYSPYFLFSLKARRGTGFLPPEIEVSDRRGFGMKHSFFWAINDQMDATIDLNYFSKLGVIPQLEYRYIPTERISGQFNGAYLKDRETKTDFFKVRLDHKQLFPQDIRGLLKVDVVRGEFNSRVESDIDILSRRYTDSFLILTKSWENSILELGIEFLERVQRIETGDERFGLLPALTFLRQQQPISSTPFYYTLLGSYTNFYEESEPERKDVQRVDLMPQLLWPIREVPWLTITSIAGIRETFYSRQRENLAMLSRELFELGVTIEGPKFSKVYKGFGEERVKHLIIPRVEYSYITDFGKEVRGRLLFLDQIDQIGASHNVTYSLTNRFLARSRPDGVRIDDLLKVSVSQRFNIEKDPITEFAEPSQGRFSTSPTRVPFEVFSRGRLSPLVFELLANPSSSFALRGSAAYELEDRFVGVNLGITIHPSPIWQFSLERNFLDERDIGREKGDFFLGRMSLNIDERWVLEYEERYNVQDQQFAEHNVRLRHKSCCFGFRFNLQHRLGETRFGFMVTLEGLGSVGR
ncbi:MAG: LPS-assembly protein LptD, partial [Candidatus Tectomicrobia bacterium]|nr:LPS-assembly protein LptD [Candidatus Tectomicrobia bacterium]